MKQLIMSVLMCLLAVSTAYGWNDTITHPQLSKYAARLLSQYGDVSFFTPGFLDSQAKGRKVLEYIGEGALLEDAGNTYQFINGTARSLNHFHDPTKSDIQKAGLSDIGSGVSAILWAQNKALQEAKGWEDWSWQTVKKYGSSAESVGAFWLRKISKCVV